MAEQLLEPSHAEGSVIEHVRGWRRFLTVDATWKALILVTSPLLLVVIRMASTWADNRVLSREMVWDLLYIMAGAWHLRAGHALHVDFHSELGALNFMLVDLGFRVMGTNVGAILVAKAIVGAAIFACAVLASSRRLPLVPAAIFVLLTWGMAILPTNVGERVNDYSFAMSYNAYCWSAIAVLSLILFIPPRPGGVRWADPVLGGALIVAMYYLKITYFGAALVEIAIALLVSDHVRKQWRMWTVVGMGAVANALAPYSWPYLADLLAAVRTGAVRTDPWVFLLMAFDNVDELVLYSIAFLIGLTLWRSGRAPIRVPVAIATFVALAMGLMTQNSQAQDLPLGLIAAFVLYDCFRRVPPAGRTVAPMSVLVALLVLPGAVAFKQTVSIVNYFNSSAKDANLLVVDHGNLDGLAVPREKDGLLTAFAEGRVDYSYLNRIREAASGDEISQFEYVQTLLEAEALLGKPGMQPGGIAVLDQVNPLPFVMNWAPARGGSMWFDMSFPWRTPEATFAEVDYVLIPKFSTYRRVTVEAKRRFGPYLSTHFPIRSESRSWIMLRRATR